MGPGARQGGDAARRFLTLGLQLGFSDGFEVIHHLVEGAFVPGTDELAYAFLRGFEAAQSYDTSPLFSVLQEACYAQGFATRWSAARIVSEFPELDLERARGPIMFTGELIFPWMFEDISRKRPLAGNLTLREREIAQHIVTGCTSKQIARLLDLSPRTVEAHRSRLMKKLGAATHGELVARLVGAG